MDVIKNKLDEFIEIGKSYVDGSIFPEDIDTADLCFYISMFFSNDLSGNWNSFRSILAMKSIKLNADDELALFNHTMRFIEFVKNLQ
jgi:hypothetical protein